jgi:hypothetical protein
MPAQPQRVRMPNKNRVDTSRSLSTNEVWRDVIKHDPYAAGVNTSSGVSSQKEDFSEQSKGLLELARLSKSTESKAMCKKCGGLGHLTFECRNTVKLPPPPPRRILPHSYTSSVLKRYSSTTTASASTASSAAIKSSVISSSSRDNISLQQGNGQKRERSRSRSRDRRIGGEEERRSEDVR